MKKFTIHVAYLTNDVDEIKLDVLSRCFQDRFKEQYPDAFLTSYFCAKELATEHEEAAVQRATTAVSH